MQQRPVSTANTILPVLLTVLALGIGACGDVVVPGDKDCLAGAVFQCECADGAQGEAQCTSDSVVGECICGGDADVSVDSVSDTGTQDASGNEVTDITEVDVPGSHAAPPGPPLRIQMTREAAPLDAG